MKVLVIPKGKKYITVKGKKEPCVYLKGYIENPADYLLKAYFSSNYNDIVVKLKEINITHKTFCKVVCSNKEYNIHILKYDDVYFVYSDRYNEIDWNYKLNAFKYKIKKIEKISKDKNIRIDNNDYKLIMKIKEMETQKKLTKKDIKNFYKITDKFNI